jgi:hypothetical protein
MPISSEMMWFLWKRKAKREVDAQEKAVALNPIREVSGKSGG